MGRRRSIPGSIQLPRGKGRAVITFIILLLAIFVATQRTPDVPGDASGDHERYHDKTFRVARVIDGDTFDLDVADPVAGKPTTRVRLWGVDAAEVSRPGQEGMYYGEEARDFAREQLAGRDVHVILSPKKTRGNYGRLLAYVTLERGGTTFNETLIAQGYAYADRRFPHHYADRFEATERRARRDGVGLWAGITTEKMPEWRREYEGE